MQSIRCSSEIVLKNNGSGLEDERVMFDGFKKEGTPRQEGNIQKGDGVRYFLQI